MDVPLPASECTSLTHPRRLVQGLEPLYSTDYGAAYCADALSVLGKLPDNSLNLVVTSPPYALEFKKEYGNASKIDYVNWIRPFAQEILRVLRPDGSFVLNIGGSYNSGSPTRSLYHFRVLLMLCDELGFHLAQECFWHNPAKLPVPAEWVNVRRQRIRDSVEYVWWFSKSKFPKADNRRVLVEYSEDMKRLVKRGLKDTKRPSGHVIKANFASDRGGSIPSNMIDRGNNESNSAYIQSCKALGLTPHPARFPAALPDFFVRLLTEPGDVVYDPFGGSNMTGYVAEQLQRYWLYSERHEPYATASAVRFNSIQPTLQLTP